MMTLNKNLLFILVFCFTANLLAISDFEKALTLQQEGDLQAAADIYESSVTTSNYSSSLFYNLALVYLGLDRVGEAYAAAIKAYRLNPRNKVYKNLMMFIQNKSQAQTLPNIYRFKLSRIDVFYFKLIFLFGLGVCLLLLSFNLLRSKKLSIAIKYLSVVLLGLIFLSYWLYQRERPVAVVLSESLIHENPDDLSSGLLKLEPNQVVEVQGESKSWIYVKNPDSKVEGWVEKSNIKYY